MTTEGGREGRGKGLGLRRVPATTAVAGDGGGSWNIHIVKVFLERRICARTQLIRFISRLAGEQGGAPRDPLLARASHE